MPLSLPAILAAASTSVETGQGPVSQFGLDIGSIVMQAVSFSVLAFVLYRWGLKPVLATMDERNAKIADGLRFEQEMHAKLADTQKQHTAMIKQAALDAQKVIDEARNSAKELLDREARATTEKTQHMLAKAEEAIALERRKMLADVRDEISRLVALTAQRVLSRELSSDERKRYAETAARELTNV